MGSGLREGGRWTEAGDENEQEGVRGRGRAVWGQVTDESRRVGGREGEMAGCERGKGRRHQEGERA